MPQRDRQYGKGRQRQQYAGKSKQLTEGQQRKDDGQRVQAYALAHQVRRQEGTFYHLADTVNDGNGNQAIEAFKLQEACNALEI